MHDYTIGLMSGTSLDGADGVLVDFSGDTLRVVATASQPFTEVFRAELLALNTPNGSDELHRCMLAANALARMYTEVVRALLREAKLQPAQIRAIGAHGQTVRHRPKEFDHVGYTVQLNSPALLAELSGIAVVAEKTHLSRETLYRTLSSRGNPTIRTLNAVLKATGLRFGVSANVC